MVRRLADSSERMVTVLSSEQHTGVGNKTAVVTARPASADEEWRMSADDSDTVM